MNINNIDFQYMRVRITPCFASNSSNCVGETIFNIQLSTIFTIMNYGFIEFYMIDTNLNSETKDPLLLDINSNFLLTFTHGIGSTLIVQMGSYEITTDTGMTPFVTEETQTGYYISNTI